MAGRAAQGRRALGGARRLAVYAAVGFACACAGTATAQFSFGDPDDVPVYVADAPAADEAVGRAVELGAAGNVREAARVLDGVLREDTGALTAWPEAGEGRFRTLRAHVHDVLLSDAALLEAYRALTGETAVALLAAGEVDEVERRYLLTDAGFDAAMRRAQRALENGRFASAYLMLEQLDRHPARTGGRASSSAGLLSTVSRFAGRGEPGDPALVQGIGGLLSAWRVDAGLDAGELPPAVVGPAGATVVDPFEGGAGGRLTGLSRRPLATVRLMSEQEAAQLELSRDRLRTQRRPASTGTPPVPVVADGAVILNNGDSVAAWDRYTLAPRWRVDIESWGDARSTAQAVQDDVNTVQVRDGLVVLVSEVPARSGLMPERVIAALELETGEPVWRRTLWELGEAGLEGAAVSGRPVIEDGVVVLTAVKRVASERLRSVWMLGLDLRTGERLWVRPIVSVGLSQRSGDAHIADGGAGAGGVVIRGEGLGAIVAIDALTGRVRWLRTQDEAGRFGRGVQAKPWEGNIPLIEGDAVLMLSPKRDWLLRLDRWSGGVISQAGASRLGSPHYLLRAGDSVVGVGERGLVAQSLASYPGEDGVETLLTFGAGANGAAGRAMPMGGRVLVPTESGVSVVSAAGGADAESFTLPASGNAVAMDGFLAVVTEEELFAFASWDVAGEQLSQRMDAEPGDPRAALTYARLAYQAGRPEAIVSAVDRALAAIERDPLDPASRAARAEMFGAVLGFIEPWREEAPGRGGDGRRDGGLADTELRGELIRRLGALASGPGERVAYLFALGEHLEQTGEPARAVERYQQIVLDERLGLAEYEAAPSRSSGAGVEATRRLRRVVEGAGRGVYAAFDAQARAELDRALAGDTAPEAFVAIARRYPLAGSVGLAWTAAATAYSESGRRSRAVFALEEALNAPRPDGEVDGGADAPPVDAEDGAAPLRDARSLWAAGKPALRAALVGELIESGRLREAATELDVLSGDGGVRVVVAGESLTVADARRRIAAMPRASAATARFGPELGRSVTVAGWVVERLPLGRLPGAPADAAVVLSGTDRIGLLRGDETTLRIAWSERSAGLPQAMDARAVYIVEPVGGGVQRSFCVVARSVETGEVLWRSPTMRDAFEGEREPTFGATVQLPLRSGVRLSEVEMLIGDESVVLVQRNGRAMGLDRSSGELRWRIAATLDVVHAAGIGGGLLLLVGGELELGQRLDENHLPESRRPGLLAIEAGTGRVLQKLRPEHALTWLTLSGAGEAIVGTTLGVEAYDPQRGERLWSAESRELTDSRAGVSVPGAVIVRASDQRLWALDSTSGLLSSAPLQLGKLMQRGFREVWLQPLREGLAVSTGHGVAVFDDALRLLGLDDRAGEGEFEPAAFSGVPFPTLPRGSRWADPVSRNDVTLRVHSLPGCRVEAVRRVETPEEITRLSAIDGWLLLSSDRHTFAVPARERGTEGGG